MPKTRCMVIGQFFSRAFVEQAKNEVTGKTITLLDGLRLTFIELDHYCDYFKTLALMLRAATFTLQFATLIALT